jgi:NADH-quinone oxidoreductase subunit A
MGFFHKSYTWKLGVFHLFSDSIAFGILLGVFLFGLSHLFSPKMINRTKLAAYECGFKSFATAREEFDIHYFIVALLFLIFDIEIIFLYPWSVSLKSLNNKAVYSMIFFVLLIVIGYAYEWKKGALNWTVR